MSLFPLVLVAHIAFAISLFLPNLLLPFALRTRRSRHARGTADPVDAHGPIVRALAWLGSTGSPVLGVGVAATGAALVAILGVQLLSQPWLLLALAIYATNLCVAFFVQRPGLRRLLGARGYADDAEQERWNARARRQRYVSYVMAGAVGVIAFLMTTKPRF